MKPTKSPSAAAFAGAESETGGTAHPQAPREGYRTFPCRRCREPLFFPTGYSAQHRSPMVCCRKCGAQTKLPMRNRWVLVAIGAAIFVAAWIYVILTWVKEDALMP